MTRPAYSRARRARQDICAIMGRWLDQRLSGDAPPISEIHDAIEARFEEEMNAAVQDALSEIHD